MQKISFVDDWPEPRVVRALPSRALCLKLQALFDLSSFCAPQDKNPSSFVVLSSNYFFSLKFIFLALRFVLFGISLMNKKKNKKKKNS